MWVHSHSRIVIFLQINLQLKEVGRWTRARCIWRRKCIICWCNAAAYAQRARGATSVLLEHRERKVLSPSRYARRSEKSAGESADQVRADEKKSLSCACDAKGDARTRASARATESHDHTQIKKSSDTSHTHTMDMTLAARRWHALICNGITVYFQAREQKLIVFVCKQFQLELPVLFLFASVF